MVSCILHRLLCMFCFLDALKLKLLFSFNFLPICYTSSFLNETHVNGWYVTVLHSGRESSTFIFVCCQVTYVFWRLYASSTRYPTCLHLDAVIENTDTLLLHFNQCPHFQRTQIKYHKAKE
jgi:hypothetical protein